VDDADVDLTGMPGCEQPARRYLLRPVVKAALRRVWRDPSTLQIGVHPDRALVLGGVGGRTADLVAAIDGTRDDEALRATAQSLGLDPTLADRLVTLLANACVIDDAASDPALDVELSHAERDRLAPDLASISIASGCLDGGLSALRRRQRSTVGIVGAGRVGATIGSLLAAAGVGHVVVEDDATCRPGDCAPAGAALVDTGASRAQAAHAAAHRASDSVRTTALSAAQPFDLVVLAPTGALDPSIHEELLRSGTTHLVASVRETTGVVGPFVVPGATACLQCLDLHRTDRDPAWPMIAAQLATDGRRSSVQACDVALATLVASVAALQLLAWIDGTDRAGSGSTLATQNGTLELTLPDWRIRRRRWSPHPSCGCHWPGGAAAAPPSNGPTDGARPGERPYP
jgi:bacteriocin biosynthesis cyclodehydratase domain-containing protein